jgi:hypothetical protein
MGMAGEKSNYSSFVVQPAKGTLFHMLCWLVGKFSIFRNTDTRTHAVQFSRFFIKVDSNKSHVTPDLLMSRNTSNNSQIVNAPRKIRHSTCQSSRALLTLLRRSGVECYILGYDCSQSGES